MSYQKFLVDNVHCSRRFHVTFDDEAAPVAKTSVACPHCKLELWSAEDHAPVKLARDENLVKTTQLSRNLVKDCHFSDKFVASKA